MAMARSQGRTAAVAVLAALGYIALTHLAAFVALSAPHSTANSRFRSRVSLAATQGDVDAAKKEWELKSWAANHLASSGSDQAAAAAARAQQAEAAYMALKAQVDGQAPPAAVRAAPVPVAASVAVAPAAESSAVSKEDLAAAKHNAQLLAWAASKLASEGAPQAASMKVKADQALAAFEAMKQVQSAGGAAPAAAAPPVPVAAPVTAAAPATSVPAGGPSAEQLEKAKRDMELHEWAAGSLADKGSPAAAAMQAKAAQSRQTYEALLAAQKAR